MVYLMQKFRSESLLCETSTHYYPSNVLSLKELSYWIAFSRVPGIGPVRFKLLLDAFREDVEAAWHADLIDLANAGLDHKLIMKFVQQRATINPEQELERLRRLRIHVITWKDQTYPPLLRKIEYPPPVLYVYGSLAEDDLRYSLAIVGTRRMSHYGRQVTERFATELARGKVTIMSGLALGVDTVAHTAALDAGGRTIAVMASGLDIIYPPRNTNLAKRIVQSGQGALLTAYPLGVQPEAGNFPARNHIIAGLSLGVLVTEAPERSGAIITASCALDSGRDVFGIPGGILSVGSAGVNKLIQDGAYPVTRVNDILERLNLHMIPQQSEAQAIIPASTEEQQLLSLLHYEAIHIDELIRSTDMPAYQVSSLLATMELKGLIRHLGGMNYVLAR